MDEAEKRYGLMQLELKDKELFDQAFSCLNAPVSDYTFANTFIWREALKMTWAYIEGHLCVFTEVEGDLRMALPPIGEGDLERCLKTCYEIMDDYNARVADTSHSVIECVSDELLERYTALGFTPVPTGGDYVYSTQKMIDLAGGEYKSKRQARSKFVREHNARTAPMSQEDVLECKRLLRSWQARGDAHAQSDDPFRKEAEALRRMDFMATELALDAIDSLGLEGMTLWAEDRLVGFTLGERLGPHQSSILIEKTDLELDGSAQYIFSEFCRQYWSELPECNVGDDWGIPSLRWTKMSYRPIRLMGKYSVLPDRSRLFGWTPSQDHVPLLITEANPRHMTSAGVPGAAASHLALDIGPARPDEFGALAGLEERVFGKEQAISKRQMRHILGSGRSIVAVARTPEGRVVGWAIVLLRRHKRSQTARLYSLAVDPDFRGKGLGHQLAEHVLDKVEEKGITRCFLEVADDNERARRLYDRLGFVPVTTLPNYYGEGRHGQRMLRVARAGREAALALSRPVGLV